MQKPIFPIVVVFTPKEIRAVRKASNMSRTQFARYFPVSPETVKSWETGKRNMYGPSSTIMQGLKTWADEQERGKREALQSALNRRKK